MELRPRKDRTSPTSNLPLSTPVSSAKVKVQCGSSCKAPTSSSSRKKPACAPNTSRSRVPKRLVCSSLDEEEKQQVEYAMSSRNDIYEERSSRKQNNVNTLIPAETSQRGERRLRGSIRKAVSAESNGDAGTDASVVLALQSFSMEVVKDCVSEVCNKGREGSTPSQRDETNRKLFEDICDGLVGQEDAEPKNTELHKSDTYINTGFDTHQEKKIEDHLNSMNGVQEVEINSFTHMLPDEHAHHAVHARDGEVRLAETRYLARNEQLMGEIREHSCANLWRSIHEEESEQDNCRSPQLEAPEATGLYPEVIAGMVPGKSLGNKMTAVRQIAEQKTDESQGEKLDRLFCTNGGKGSIKSERSWSSSKEDTQQGIIDKEGYDGAMDDLHQEKQGLVSPGKNETTDAEVSICRRWDKETDKNKYTDTLEANSEAEKNNFQGSYIKESKVRREDVGDEIEDEHEMAKLFVRSLKRHLQQTSDKLGVMNMQREVAASVDGRVNNENILLKDALNKVQEISKKGSSMGRSWSPEIGLQSAKSYGRTERDSDGTIKRVAETLWQKERELKDGLLVPPMDPHKLNKLARKQQKVTAGAKWFHLSARTITPELKKELQLLKLRRVADPKRHYKAEDSKGLPKYFQVGTVVGSPADFYSGRVTKREQKSTLADELLSDPSITAYRKRKYSEIQDEKQAGGKKFWKQKKQQRAPSWAKI